MNGSFEGLYFMHYMQIAISGVYSLIDLAKKTMGECSLQQRSCDCFLQSTKCRHCLPD